MSKFGGMYLGVYRKSPEDLGSIVARALKAPCRTMMDMVEWCPNGRKNRVAQVNARAAIFGFALPNSNGMHLRVYRKCPEDLVAMAAIAPKGEWAVLDGTMKIVLRPKTEDLRVVPVDHPKCGDQ